MVIWMQMIMGSGTSAILLNVVSHKKIHYKRGVKQVTHSPPPYYLSWQLAYYKVLSIMQCIEVSYPCQFLTYVELISQ
jgi:hypothetical protein